MRRDGHTAEGPRPEGREPALLSPVGDSVESHRGNSAQTSKAYRDEWARLAPYEAIARVVIRRRLELGLTQLEVAQRMRTSHSAISRVESGRHPTKQETLARLAEALEMRYVHGFETGSAETLERQLVGLTSEPRAAGG
jgi:ribosome-binding protein aMBF1 (putative translation factor)